MWPGVDPRWGLAGALIFGWVWGSFVNQTVDRAPRRASAPPPPRAPGGDRAVGPPGRLSLLHPARSLCLTCGAAIAWRDNLPIFSYLLLGGRCRACGTGYGGRTLALEIAVPAGFGALFLLEVGGLAAVPVFPWGYLGLSWCLGAAVRWAEGRRGGGWFWVAGLVWALGMAAQALWQGV